MPVAPRRLVSAVRVNAEMLIHPRQSSCPHFLRMNSALAGVEKARQFVLLPSH
ncbi:MAG: hypothetical protein ABSA83_23965 [Verrucomicrobiota bacterium]